LALENKENWLQILNNMVQRGLKKVLILVSDDFSGLHQAIKQLFPLTDHQLCLVHLQRNARKNMSKNDAKVFNQELAKIKLS